MPPPERFAAAAAAGFTAVESPFEHYDQTPEAAAALATAAGVECVLINTPKGNWEQGERGLAAVPGRVCCLEDFSILSKCRASQQTHNVV